MTILPWRDNPYCTVGFLSASHRDGETHRSGEAGLLLSLWVGAGGAVQFRHRAGYLEIGLVGTPRGKRKSRRR